MPERQGRDRLAVKVLKIILTIYNVSERISAAERSKMRG